MSDLNHVKRGQSFSIPAKDYNAMIDTARAFQTQGAMQSGTLGHALNANIVLIQNKSGADRSRFEILGVDTVLITPTANEAEFTTRITLEGITPDEDEHTGNFVILLEPIADGAIGRALISGVCQVKIDVGDEDHAYADITDADASKLTSGPFGAAQILWKESGTGEKWAVIRLGNPLPMHVFPVDLTQVGGYQGDEENPATWTYDVLDVATGDTLESAVDPTADPHKWQRPSIGWMITATCGYAHYAINESGTYDLVLGWINEMVDQEACETEST